VERLDRFVLPHFSDSVIWMMFAVVFLVNFGHILMSFKMDLMNPKLSEYASTGSLTKNENISKSITAGLVISILFGIGSALLLIEDYVTGWVRILLLAAAFLGAWLYLFQSYLKSYFIDIEY
jgi:protein-S-isoprenylcysteine O-methyltransferase Ste14